MQNNIVINANIEQNKNISASIENNQNLTASGTKRGPQGIPGEAATIELGTVNTGEAGTDVIITNSGTENAAVFNFTIPRGDKGEQGIQGIQGETGNGIINTEYVSSSGLVDTYHVNYTNGNYDSFTVTNGRDGDTSWGSITGSLNNQTDLQTELNGLQSQIDAIVSSSDVFDIVGTYAELQAYDITTVPVNDVIKVLVDSTHSGAATYYRCVESGGVKSWSYIGAEGAYYTKAESDSKFATFNDLPTVGDGTITIQQDGENIGTFTTNQSGNSTINLTGGSSRNIGEIVTSTIPLTDAGLHLLDGALIQHGSYSAFVDYIADLYNNTPVEDIYNVNIVGSLTNDNGVLSGFAEGVYATIKEVPYSTADSIEILLKTTTGTLDTSNYKCFYSPVISNFRGVDLQITPNSKIQLYVSSNAGSSWDIVNGVVGTTTLQSDTQYYFKYVYTGTNHIVYMSTTGAFAGEETTEVNVTNSGKPSNSTVSLGLQAWSTTQNNYYWRGSIDLNESYININGERWWSGKTERRAGFFTKDEWQQSVTDYGVCGKFVYNSVNNTVRLPKVSDILQGTTDLTAIGDLVEAGLPNITGSLSFSGLEIIRDASGAISTYQTSYGKGNASGSSTQFGFTIDASRSSSIYGNSTTVQPQTIKVLYYIVIATSTKTDIQVDIDEIATDLNGKADVDLTNVNNAGTSKGAGWAMPSDTYIDLALGASGSTYTAPANGWIYFSKVASATGQFANLVWGNLVDERAASYSRQHLTCLLPVTKNAVIVCYYNADGAVDAFRFYYAVGSESEAQ